MHQHHQPPPTTPCFKKSFSKSGQVRFDNSFVEYSSVNRADIPNQQLSLTGLKPYRLMSINRGLFRSPRAHATSLIQIQPHHGDPCKKSSTATCTGRNGKNTVDHDSHV